MRKDSGVWGRVVSTEGVVIETWHVLREMKRVLGD